MNFIQYCINKYISKRLPNQSISNNGSLYLERWYIIPKNKYFNIYLHLFHRGDSDRELHDHPWWNLSIPLTIGYIEETKKGVFQRNPGRCIIRNAKTPHRIELINNQKCWSLFITGPIIRKWGFYCKDGKWNQFQEFIRNKCE